FCYFHEMLLTHYYVGTLWNCAVLELHSGKNLLAYRSGNTSSRSLTVLNGEYILRAQLWKNFINVWEIQRKVAKNRVSWDCDMPYCFPNGLYLLAGIAEVSTGNLLAILNRHYQDLTCLRGKDNLALVWSLASVVQLDPSLTPEPRHVLCHHSLPITDIHCGLMGPQSRVATASLDQTVKLWELSSGELLLSVLFDVGIMSVTLDPCEYCLFCGGSDGGIFQVSLCSQVIGIRHLSDNESNQVFKGHRKLVTCLSVSMDGTLLLSGSHDETIRVWDIQSKQSIRSINTKVSPVTNALIIPAPANMFLPDSRPGIPLPRFSRHLNPLVQAEGTETGGALNETYLEKADKLYSLMTAVTDKWVFVNGENTKVRVSELEEEVRALKKVNKDLYDFSTQLLTKPS
uniref:WD repeat-containing protein 18 n=1 Tax=Oncorhynchus tshawytscha TaxID=74940 RepID=A0A8C8HL91_ONCTS